MQLNSSNQLSLSLSKIIAKLERMQKTTSPLKVKVNLNWGLAYCGKNLNWGVTYCGKKTAEISETADQNSK